MALIFLSLNFLVSEQILSTKFLNFRKLLSKCRVAWGEVVFLERGQKASSESVSSWFLHLLAKDSYLLTISLK